MNILIATACAAFTLAMAGSAFADGRVTATLDSPQSAQARLIVGPAAWNCEGATCVANGQPEDTAGLGACRDLARKVGRISSYVSDARTLDAAALAKCNKSAAVSVPVTAASR
jgi:hypothetical protein